MKKQSKPQTPSAKDKKLALLKEVVRDHLTSVQGGFGGGGCDTTTNSCCPTQ